MSKIRLTKRFTFEMAHALLGYDGLCSNIHGHSYVLWVTIIGEPLIDDLNTKNGMVMDFSVLSRIIKTKIIEVFDHALVLNKKASENSSVSFDINSEKVIFVEFQPTCENLIQDFLKRISQIESDKVKIFSLKLQETETSYAEWYAGDN